MFQRLRRSAFIVTLVVATPSFAELAARDGMAQAKKCPDLRFEQLRNETRKEKELKPYNGYGRLAARFAHGMTFPVWLQLMYQNGFRMSPSRISTAASITVTAIFNSVLTAIDNAFFWREIEASKLDQPPIFILGHWRSGTTLLHELLTLDDNHFSPSTYQCMMPGHFRVSESWLKNALKVFLPSRRPMDNMAMDFDKPQEDEFALCNSGAPSPYRVFGYGRRHGETMRHLDVGAMSPAERKTWEETLVRFYKRVAYGKKGRLLLKSPTHTARIAALKKQFPGAKFVHISRAPEALLTSTIHTWRALMHTQAIELPGELPGIEEYVIRNHQIMYDNYLLDRQTLGDDELVEIRFEDLVQDKAGTVRQIYQKLGLSGFDTLAPKLAEEEKARQSYKRNKLPAVSDPEHLRYSWRDYIKAFGY